MATSKDLLLAILALDSYNRGYNVGIGGLSQDPGTKIGNATVGKNAQTDLSPGTAQAAGFYAVSYTLTSGETVISYRGTDNPISLSNLNPWSDGITVTVTELINSPLLLH
jgi:hypothetical protein